MDDGQDPVEFDMSFSTNTRINYNLWQCNLASTQRDPHKWYFSCKNLFKEIVTDLKDIEFCNHLLMEDETVIALEAYDNYTYHYQTYNKKNQPYTPPTQIFDRLFEWEITIRKKLNKMGLLFRRKDTYAI